MGTRRLEITVPTEWSEFVKECLEDKKRCNLNKELEKPNMVCIYIIMTIYIYIYIILQL